MFVYWASGTSESRCAPIHVTDRCYRTPLLILAPVTARSTSRIAVTRPLADPGPCNGQIHVPDRCNRTPLLILALVTAGSTSRIAVTGPRC